MCGGRCCCSRCSLLTTNETRLALSRRYAAGRVSRGEVWEDVDARADLSLDVGGRCLLRESSRFGGPTLRQRMSGRDVFGTVVAYGPRAAGVVAAVLALGRRARYEERERAKSRKWVVSVCVLNDDEANDAGDAVPDWSRGALLRFAADDLAAAKELLVGVLRPLEAEVGCCPYEVVAQ